MENNDTHEQQESNGRALIALATVGQPLVAAAPESICATALGLVSVLNASSVIQVRVHVGVRVDITTTTTIMTPHVWAPERCNELNSSASPQSSWSAPLPFGMCYINNQRG